MRVLVCGGRTFGAFLDGKHHMVTRKEQAFIEQALDEICGETTPTQPLVFESRFHDVVTHVIVGGAKGADTIAERWAREKSIPVTVYPANWDRDKKAAGPIRNKLMLTDGKPDLVVAFPGGSGTGNMIAQAVKAGVKVIPLEMPR